MGPSEILPGSHCLRTLLSPDLDTDAEVQVWNPEATAASYLSPIKLTTPLRQGTITMVHCKNKKFVKPAWPRCGLSSAYL
eukprot:COSAG06_NODE_1092_length_10744_cov_67.135181_5_plen_80_part_00